MLVIVLLFSTVLLIAAYVWFWCFGGFDCSVCVQVLIMIVKFFDNMMVSMGNVLDRTKSGHNLFEISCSYICLNYCARIDWASGLTSWSVKRVKVVCSSDSGKVVFGIWEDDGFRIMVVLKHKFWFADYEVLNVYIIYCRFSKFKNFTLCKRKKYRKKGFGLVLLVLHGLV